MTIGAEVPSVAATEGATVVLIGALVGTASGAEDGFAVTTSSAGAGQNAPLPLLLNHIWIAHHSRSMPRKSNQLSGRTVIAQLTIDSHVG